MTLNECFEKSSIARERVLPNHHSLPVAQNAHIGSVPEGIDFFDPDQSDFSTLLSSSSSDLSVTFGIDSSSLPTSRRGSFGPGLPPEFGHVIGDVMSLVPNVSAHPSTFALATTTSANVSHEWTADQHSQYGVRMVENFPLSTSPSVSFANCHRLHMETVPSAIPLLPENALTSGPISGFSELLCGGDVPSSVGSSTPWALSPLLNASSSGARPPVPETWEGNQGQWSPSPDPQPAFFGASSAGSSAALRETSSRCSRASRTMTRAPYPTHKAFSHPNIQTAS
ncbi:hypothetical protein BS17DRAFT_783632 [Gyrodon lividus]|nr:hypothetical protein BS17DRAFT_783632 [Gyrodon lividus]